LVVTLLNVWTFFYTVKHVSTDWDRIQQFLTTSLS
jgi:hypothetical protein